MLKNTPYKWLDIVALITHICHVQNPKIDILGIKFFTAPVITRVSSRGEKAQHAQETYHRALSNSYPDIFKIINGYYILEQGHFPEYKKPLVKEDIAKAS